MNASIGVGGARPPFRHVNFMPPSVAVERRADGVVILRSTLALGPFERNIVAYLHRWSESAPERVMLAERGPDKAWARVSYGEMRRRVDLVAASLLARGLNADRPVMILSGNSIDHAVLMLAALTVGVPVAPVSVAYSLMSQDHGKLRHVFALVQPKLIFVQNGRLFEGALGSLDLDGVEVVAATAPPESIAATPFADLLSGRGEEAVAAAYAATGPDTVAKILFTSGSTGLPKGVINTQRMLCANQRMSEVVLPPDAAAPPVLLDWLPWNHTFGGNYNFNLSMRQGGTIHIDGGRPLPGMFEQTLANLREISPTQYSNVPAGFAMLAPELEKDAALSQRFFRDLKVLAYGGASLPNELWQHYQDLAVRTRGERVAFISGWGSTETAPTATSVHWLTERSGIIGLPFPGVELKMVPVGKTFELRLKGPTVMPGYLRRPDLTAEAFDEEGFYKIGDAGRLVDPDDPAQGLAFDGRVVEDFKLSSGTFVQVGALRVAVLGATQPALQDLVVAGHDKPYVALLAWPNLAACKEICRDPAARESIAGLLGSAEILAHVRAGLQRYNAAAGGSSARVARILLLAAPPSIDGNEITDKGYINQRATLERRADLVQRLYSDPPPPEVIVV
mgnify:CR=1 FL=1